MLTPRNPLVWVGLAGVADDDNAAAHTWQKRLHWIMVGMALLSLLAAKSAWRAWHAAPATAVEGEPRVPVAHW